MTQEKGPSLKMLSSAVMVFVYLAVAYMLAFTSIFDNDSISVNKWGRYGIAVVMFLYGLFRAYRIWRDK